MAARTISGTSCRPLGGGHCRDEVFQVGGVVRGISKCIPAKKETKGDAVAAGKVKKEEGATASAASGAGKSASGSGAGAVKTDEKDKDAVVAPAVLKSRRPDAYTRVVGVFT